MPTGDDFREAADSLRAALEICTSLRPTLGAVGSDHGVTGGMHERTVELAVMVTEANCSQLATKIESAISTCEIRAARCDTHVAALAAWDEELAGWQERRGEYLASLGEPNQQVRSPGCAPERPTAPAWVEPP